MTGFQVRETFFRPDQAFARESSALPADLHNSLQRVLKRCGGTCCFLPVRTMQYQAVIEREEIIFVDAAGGYAHQDGVGGRLIRLAWRPRPGARDSLTEPVPCEILYYFPDLAETQRRLIGETRAALRLALERQREAIAPIGEHRVVPLRRR